MSSSVLNDIKHLLGILPDETAFDVDIVNYINSAFGTLTQLGVGPADGFAIEDSTDVWDDFYTDPRYSAVKTYVFLYTKLAFDPPNSGFATQAIERQKLELEFRLNVMADYG